MQFFDNIIAIIHIFLLIWGGLTLIGLIIYITGYADSWEKGLITAISGWWKSFYEYLTGIDSSQMTVNVSLLLSPAEQKELLRRFQNHPFDTPAFYAPPTRANDCLWIDVKADGLIEKYKALERSQLQEMAVNTIQNFYFEIRDMVAVPVYIKILASDRLYFAIPLSAASQKMLERQDLARTPTASKKIPPMIVEDIEIDLHNEREK